MCSSQFAFVQSKLSLFNLLASVADYLIMGCLQKNKISDAKILDWEKKNTDHRPKAKWSAAKPRFEASTTELLARHNLPFC